MRKQLNSLAQVINFCKISRSTGGGLTQHPPCVRSCFHRHTTERSPALSVCTLNEHHSILPTFFRCLAINVRGSRLSYLRFTFKQSLYHAEFKMAFPAKYHLSKKHCKLRDNGFEIRPVSSKLRPTIAKTGIENSLQTLSPTWTVMKLWHKFILGIIYLSRSCKIKQPNLQKIWRTTELCLGKFRLYKETRQKQFYTWVEIATKGFVNLCKYQGLTWCTIHLLKIMNFLMWILYWEVCPPLL